jgi:hypothetical protein
MDRFRQELDDPLRRAVGTFTLATAGGAGAWFASGGPVRIALGVLAALAALLFFATLVSSGLWQSKELEENAYRKMRDADARQRKSVKYERGITRTLIDAREGHYDLATHRARVEGCLETLRGHLAGQSAEPIDLLVARIASDGETCLVLHHAGKFASNMIRSPAASVDDLLAELADDEGSFAYWAPFRLDEISHRLVAISTGPLDEHIRSELHRAAGVFQTLAQTLTDQAAAIGPDTAAARMSQPTSTTMDV